MQHIVNHQTQLPGHCIWHVAKTVHKVALEILLKNIFSFAEIDLYQEATCYSNCTYMGIIMK